MYYTYVIRCEDNSLYTGITTDLERRMKEHFEKNENMLIVDLDTEELQKYREETAEKAYRYYPSKARNELYL